VFLASGSRLESEPKSKKEDRTRMRDFRAKFREVSGGELLWERLDQTTCGREFILILLQVHCGAQVKSSERERVESYLALRKKLARRLDGLAKRFKNITREIARVAPEVPVAVSVRHSAPLTLPAQVLATASKQLRGLSLKTVSMYSLYQITSYMKSIRNFKAILGGLVGVALCVGLVLLLLLIY
jgi:hypothetical protein